jgi:hypothetical protein
LHPSQVKFSNTSIFEKDCSASMTLLIWVTSKLRSTKGSNLSEQWLHSGQCNWAKKKVNSIWHWVITD